MYDRQAGPPASGRNIPRPAQHHGPQRRLTTRQLTRRRCQTLQRSLNLSHFVAHKLWRWRDISPLCGRAHLLQRRKPFRCLRTHGPPPSTCYKLLEIERLREAESLATALADPARLGQVAIFLSTHFYLRDAYDQAIAAAQRALA
jgi:hypothetical protein